MPGGRNSRRRREDDWDGELPSTSAQTSVTLAAHESTQLEPALAVAMPRARTTRRRRDDNWDGKMLSTSQTSATLSADKSTQLEPALVSARPTDRTIRRRRNDDWDNELPSTPDQAPATLPAKEMIQLEPGLVTARVSARTLRRRIEDTWDATVSAQPGNLSPPKSPDESAERSLEDCARPLSFSRVMTWNEILDARETPSTDATTTTSHAERPHLPRSQEAYTRPPSRSSPALLELVRPPTSLEGSLLAGSFVPEPALWPGSEEPPSALAQPESFGVVSTTWKWNVP